MMGVSFGTEAPQPERALIQVKKVIALIVGVALTVPGVAAAQGGSTCQAYNPQLCSQVSSGNAAHATPTVASTAGALPFTGLDVVLLTAGGAVLLAGGLVVRRLSRDTQDGNL